MDFAKLRERQKKSREDKYILSDTEAEEQIFSLIDHYDIDLTFEIEGFLDEEMQAELNQMTDDEKKAGGGVKQIIKDLAHWIKRGVITIEKKGTDLIITHDLISPIGEQSENSEPIKEFVYASVKPKHTEKMAGLSDEKYTFTQKAEFLMSFLSGNRIEIFNQLGSLDKRAARSVGILLLIAL